MNGFKTSKMVTFVMHEEGAAHPSMATADENIECAQEIVLIDRTLNAHMRLFC